MDSKSEFSTLKSAQMIISAVAFVGLSAYLLFLSVYFMYQVMSGHITLPV